jgi:ribosomal-protein-alanine N-acetyltransferase
VLARPPAGDADDLHRRHTDPQVMATLGGTRTHEESQRVLDAQLANWAADGFGYWLARNRFTGHFVGRGGLRRVLIEARAEVEVGYAFLPEYWGIGLATELAQESVRVGFVELALQDLVCFTPPNTRGSQRVISHTGFQQERDTFRVGRGAVLQTVGSVAGSLSVTLTRATPARSRRSARCRSMLTESPGCLSTDWYAPACTGRATPRNSRRSSRRW